MANAIIVSINGLDEISDHININKAAFTTTISLHKLNNTCYPYQKALVRSYLTD